MHAGSHRSFSAMRPPRKPPNAGRLSREYLTPQRQKQKTQEAVLAVLLARATRQPVLFIVEDLHWVDPSTLELLSFIIEQVPTARLLTLFVFRPEFRPPWAPRAHLTQLTLSRLPGQQTEMMVARVAGGKALPGEVVQQVVAKTDGVPLFVEELTKAMLESGLLREGEDGYALMGPLPPLAIPTTLHDSLMARLDRLATGKEVAQLGATIRHMFAYELLQAVFPLDEATLQQGLRQLVEAELIYQRGLPPQTTYLFKHALIQEAAYQSLLKSRRQQHHQRIGQVLAERFPETAETQPELLAHHYTEAGLREQAMPYWQHAGQRALQRSANLEAVSHVTRGLEVLSTLPETHERAQQELVLQITLGAAMAGANVPATKLLAATLERIVVERPQPPAERPQHRCLAKGDAHPTGHAPVVACPYVPHSRCMGEDKRDPHGQKPSPARRGVVERTLAWLAKWRGLLRRTKKQALNLLGLRHLAWALIRMRRRTRLIGD